ncbi:MAG: hypothetical protein HYV96_19170 [Opitutae bacterium]|nr:hypothetical protein [Opitutae bacterium]
MLLARRIPLLIVLLGLAVLATWQALLHFEQRELERVFARLAASREEQLREALAALDQPLRRWVDHLAAHRDLDTHGSLRPDDWAGLWRIDASGHVALAEPAPGATLPPEPEAAELHAALVGADAAHRHFFLRPAGGPLYEAFAAPLADGGWICGFEIWGSQRLQSISRLAGTYSRLSLLHEEELINVELSRVHLHLPLVDFRGRTVQLLDADYRGDELQEIGGMHGRLAWFFLAALVTLLVTAGWCLRHWLVRPLFQLAASLRSDDPAALGPLLRRRDEFGQLARLLRDAFATRAQLRQTLDERTRLARDLHDGVIQSIYGAGMGLTRARAALPANPAEAARVIGATHATLNAAIADLREFIKQAGASNATAADFAANAAELVRQLQPGGGVELELDVDPALPPRHSPAAQVELYQIVREGASNALRHGRATHLRLRWQATDDGSVFELTDNGAGFVPASATDGSGLGNLAERAAALGGAVQIDSAPGRGTTLRVRLPAAA